MSDQESTEQVEEIGEAGNEAEIEQPQNEPPRFDEQYVKSLRAEAAKHRRELREAQQRLRELEDAGKTESERLVERVSSAEKKATELERELARARVALRKGLTEAQARRLVGETEEELEADADELVKTFAAPNEQVSTATPRERLRPGAVPQAEPEEMDPAKLAAKIPRLYQGL